MAAAVADFTPAAPADDKIARDDGLTLELSPTPDLLAEVARSGGGRVGRRRGRALRPILVGFAAETGSLDRAAGKLQSKGVDLLVANDVSEAGSGFGTDTNRVDDPGSRRREARSCPSSPSARWRTASWTGWHERWTPETRRRRLRGMQERRPRGIDRMSATDKDVRRLTVSDIARLYADGERIPMLTAYDYPTARILDDAGVPMLLVGDSLGQVMLGYETTVQVTMEEMLHHTRAVVRGTTAGARDRRHAVPLVPDDRGGDRERRAVHAATAARRRSRSRAACAARGSSRRSSGPACRSWATSAGPRSRSTASAARSRSRARRATRRGHCSPTRVAIQEAGAFSIVLELVPEQLAAVITSRLRIPTIGIGAGPHCSGQVQVIPDMLGLGDFHPKHARAYADLQGTIAEATRRWMADVAAGHLPRRPPRPSGWTTRSSTRRSAATPTIAPRDRDRRPR